MNDLPDENLPEAAITNIVADIVMSDQFKPLLKTFGAQWQYDMLQDMTLEIFISAMDFRDQQYQEAIE